MVNDKIIAWFIVIITLISVVPANALYPTIPLSSNENALPFVFSNESTGSNNSTLVNQSTINSSVADTSSSSDDYIYHYDYDVNLSDSDTCSDDNICENEPLSTDETSSDDVVDCNHETLSDDSTSSDDEIGCKHLNLTNKSINVKPVRNITVHERHVVPEKVKHVNKVDNDVNNDSTSSDDDIYENKPDDSYDPAENYHPGNVAPALPDYGKGIPSIDVNDPKHFDVRNPHSKLQIDLNFDSSFMSVSLDNGYCYIDGNGHTINFDNVGLFLSVYKGATVIFQNINFTSNGNNINFLRNYGGIALFVGCTFNGFNNNYDNSPLFFNEGGTIALVNCNFINNTGVSGGIIYNCSDGAVYIQDCTFDNNSAISNGGVIYSNKGYIAILGSLFNNNKAVNGGVINSINTFIWVSDTIGHIADPSFNTVFTYIIGVVSGNAQNYDIVDFGVPKFNNNNATNNGGVISGTNTGLMVANTTFDNNNANLGGALYLMGRSIVELVATTFTNNNAYQGASLYLDNNYDVNINSSSFLNNLESYVDNRVGYGIYAIVSGGKILLDNKDILEDMRNTVYVKYHDDELPPSDKRGRAITIGAVGVALILTGFALLYLAGAFTATAFLTFGITAGQALVLFIIGIALITIGLILIASAIQGTVSDTLGHTKKFDGTYNNWMKMIVFGSLIVGIIAVTIISIVAPPASGVGLSTLVVSWLGVGSGVGGSIVSFIVTSVIGGLQALPMIGLMFLSDYFSPYLGETLSKLLFFTLFFGVIAMIAINPIISLKNGIKTVGNLYTVIVGFSSVIASLTLLIIATVSDNPIYGRILMYLLAVVTVLLSAGSFYQNIMKIKKKFSRFNFKYTILNKTDYIKFIFSSILIISSVISIDYLFNHNKNKIAYVLMILMAGIFQCVESIKSQPLIKYSILETGLKNTRFIERNSVFNYDGNVTQIRNEVEVIFTRENYVDLLDDNLHGMDDTGEVPEMLKVPELTISKFVVLELTMPKPVVLELRVQKLVVPKIKLLKKELTMSKPVVPEPVVPEHVVPEPVVPEPVVPKPRPKHPQFSSCKNWDYILLSYRDQVIEMKKIANTAFSEIGIKLDNSRLLKIDGHIMSPQVFFTFIKNAKFSINGYAYYDNFEPIEFIKLRKTLRKNYNCIEPEKIKNRLLNFYKIMLELNAQNIQPIAAIQHFISERVINIKSNYIKEETNVLIHRVIDRLYKDGLFVKDKPIPLLNIDVFDPDFYQGRNEPFLLDKTNKHSIVYFLPEIDGYIDLFNRALDNVAITTDRIGVGANEEDLSHITLCKAIANIYYFHSDYLAPPIIFNGYLSYFGPKGIPIPPYELYTNVPHNRNFLNMITQFNDQGFTFITLDKEETVDIMHHSIRGNMIDRLIKKTEENCDYLNDIKSDFCKYVDKFILYDDYRGRTFVGRKSFVFETTEKMLLKYIGTHDFTSPNFNLDALDLYNYFLVVDELQKVAIFNKFMGCRSPLQPFDNILFKIQGEEFTLPQLWNHIICSRVSADGHFYPCNGNRLNPIPVSDVYNFLSINFKYLTTPAEVATYNSFLKVEDQIKLPPNIPSDFSLLIFKDDNCPLTVMEGIAKTNADNASANINNIIRSIPIDYKAPIFNYYNHSDFTPNRIMEIVNKYHIPYSIIDNLLNEYKLHTYIRPCNFINVLIYSIMIHYHNYFFGNFINMFIKKIEF
jgi:predicted outer membrane repeat protein